jgi:hypothetical protein
MTTHSSMYVLGVSGSLRSASYNTALLRAAAELLYSGVAMSSHWPASRWPSWEPARVTSARCEPS